jgi:hypothetical protein
MPPINGGETGIASFGIQPHEFEGRPHMTTSTAAITAAQLDNPILTIQFESETDG